MKKTIFAILAIMLVGLVAVSAFGPKWLNEESEQALEDNDYEAFVDATGKNIPEERFGHMVERYQMHESVKEAIENQDYDAWVAAHDERPDITNIVNPENWERYLEMHEAMENGDHETAKEIADELGLPAGMMNKRNQGRFQDKNAGQKLGRGQHSGQNRACSEI